MRSRSRSCSEMSISLSAAPSPAEREALRAPRSPPAAAPPPLVGALIDSLSFRSCGFGRAASSAFEKEDLRLRATFPQRLRDALHAALKARDPSAGAFALAEAPGVGAPANPWFGLEPEDAPENPLVAFVNPRSGGRLGPVLKTRLQELIGEDQVFDITVVKPSEFVEYALGCLEQLAGSGDHSARSVRHNLRIMVAGGDGTVGWVLGCLGELYVQNREPVPPVAVIPLGTGNDLSRSFGWGASFPFSWKAAAKRSLYKAILGTVSCLDSWHVVVSMPEGEEEQELDLPHSLRHLGECTFYDGWMLKWLMDFTSYVMTSHSLLDTLPFFFFCKHDCDELPCVRAIVALNLHNYASGRNPWGNLKPEYLEKVR
uniref:Uncharacterized protein n=1 Tax=Avena sativa TaxID=4498 RepID=A0ACD6ABQ3_AVESA